MPAGRGVAARVSRHGLAWASVYRLSREVRFAIDLTAPAGRAVGGHNGFAGKPPVTGVGQIYYALAVTVGGEPDASGYLVNIKRVDDAVRDRAVPLVKEAVRRVVRAGYDGDKGEDGDGGRGHLGGGGMVRDVFESLDGRFAPHGLLGVELALSPYTSLSRRRDRVEHDPMTYLKHAFEFAASHRLHDPSASEEENRRLFGKCANPHGHGHNYRVEVAVRGEPDARGHLMAIGELERLVDEAVIREFDHKHLNAEVEEFLDGSPGRLNPSVEHIAAVAYRRLSRAWPAGARASLDAVTVWETPKTWCEYRG